MTKIENKFSNVVRSIVTIGLIPLILFLPAGRLDWYEGWLFLLGFLSAVGALAIWGYRTRPELMRERTQAGENVKPWDRLILGIYTLLLIVMLVVAGLDSGRFGWSDPPLFLRIMAWIGLLLGFSLVWWTMVVNPFLSEQVRIQNNRGHQVVSGGPYKFVRHPMYDGVILAILCVPIILGSYWALIPASLIIFLFILRTALEDRTLQEELPGYRDYAEDVRYRLIPYIW